MLWNSLRSESGAVILNRYDFVPVNTVKNTGW
jgi:hypothetical protein